MITIFPLWTFHLYVVTIQQHMCYVYLSVDTMSQSLLFLELIPCYIVAANKEVTSKSLWSPSFLRIAVLYITRVTRRAPLAEQELNAVSVRCALVHPRFLVGFVLLNL